MEITTNAIIFLHAFYCVVGEFVASEVKSTLELDHNASTIQPNSTPHDQLLHSQSEIVAATIPPSNDEISRPSNYSVNSKSTATLVHKVISAIRSKPPLASVSEKQIFNGRLPVVIERIVQRIQNFFSVRNPPEYFENSRPPLTADNGIIECTDNVQNDSIACNSLIISPENTATEVDCDDGPTESEAVVSTQQPAPADGESVNVVVTHTVVHDDTINVYSPETDAAAPTQVFSNVVVILEPSADEYSPPAQPDPNRQKNKFYVYVNPTAANKKNNQQQTGKLDGGDDEQPQPFEPYTNATYTVVIKGDKLEEFSNNIENGDNNSLNPDLSTYFDNTTDKLGKLEADETVQTKTIASPKNSNAPGDVPNINLVLVPPQKVGHGNPACTKDQYQSSDIEYYVLKPDNGALNKKKNVTSSQKIDAAYLPPPSNDDYSRPTNTVNNIVSSGTNTRFPSLFNLFNRRPEEPRVRDDAIR